MRAGISPSLGFSQGTWQLWACSKPFLACKHPAASRLLRAGQGSIGSAAWMNSETLGWGISSAGLLPGGILPLPLVKGNTAAKYSCYPYLVLPCLCTSWREARIAKCLPQMRGWGISCRDVYTALHASASAGTHTGISFHCVSPAVFKQEHCPSFTLTEKNNFHQQSCIYLLPKEDILPVPLYIGHLLWPSQEFQAPLHSRAYTQEIPPLFPVFLTWNLTRKWDPSDRKVQRQGSEEYSRFVPFQCFWVTMVHLPRFPRWPRQRSLRNIKLLASSLLSVLHPCPGCPVCYCWITSV